MARGKQEEMFEQKKINEIEAAIIKADEKRALIEDFNTREKDELKNLEHKIRETLHKHLAALDAQEDGEGNKRYVYKRGEYEAELKGHERLSYGKVRQKEEPAE